MSGFPSGSWCLNRLARDLTDKIMHDDEEGGTAVVTKRMRMVCVDATRKKACVIYCITEESPG